MAVAHITVSAGSSRFAFLCQGAARSPILSKLRMKVFTYKATFTDLRSLVRNFLTFSLACLFYFTFGPKVSYIGER